MDEEVQLTVAPILKQGDVGKSIARVSEDIMEKLGVKEADIIEIEGPEKPSYEALKDEGNGGIPINSSERVDSSKTIKLSDKMAIINYSKKTGAIVRPIREENIDSDIIRLDRFKRKSINTLIEEKVTVKKADEHHGAQWKPYNGPDDGFRLAWPIAYR